MAFSQLYLYLTDTKTAATVGKNTQWQPTNDKRQSTTDNDSDNRRRRPFTVATCARYACSRAKLTYVYLPDRKQKNKTNKKKRQTSASEDKNDAGKVLSTMTMIVLYYARLHLQKPTTCHCWESHNRWNRIDINMGPRERWRDYRATRINLAKTPLTSAHNQLQRQKGAADADRATDTDTSTAAFANVSVRYSASLCACMYFQHTFQSSLIGRIKFI